ERRERSGVHDQAPGLDRRVAGTLLALAHDALGPHRLDRQFHLDACRAHGHLPAAADDVPPPPRLTVVARLEHVGGRRADPVGVVAGVEVDVLVADAQRPGPGRRVDPGVRLRALVARDLLELHGVLDAGAPRVAGVEDAEDAALAVRHRDHDA